MFDYFQGQIECDSETVFELAAHVLQASLGDYTEWVKTYCLVYWNVQFDPWFTFLFNRTL